MADRSKLTEGPIGPALRSLALPISVGIVFLILLNLVDTYFVGQLGTDELAAMSFTFPVITLVISVAMGLGVGATSAVSRAIGAGDERTVRRLTTHALALAILVVALVSSIGVVTQDAVFTALGAEERLLPLLREYMTIWFAGAVFLVVPMVGNGVLRAGGDAKTPMYLMIGAAIVNGVLDPILIFGWFGAPRLGLAGAAIATLAARSTTLFFAMLVLWRRNMLDLHVPALGELLDSWRKIVSVGVPAAITNALGPVATAVMTALIAREGQEAVAAYGVGSRVEGLLLIAPWGLTAALTPFIGQNWGAHKEERVAQALKLSNRFVFVWGVAAWLVLLPTAGWFAQIFTDDPTVIQTVTDYLWIVPVSYGCSGIVSVASAAFNAVDKAVRSTLLSATKSLLLAVPLAWAGGTFAGIEGIFGGIVLATVITSGLALIWLRTLTQPHADTHAPDVSKTAIRRLSVAMHASIKNLLHQLEHMDELAVRPRPINTVGFYVHGRELGHVHRDGRVDLHLPPEVHDVVIDEGKADFHPVHHDACWVTHRLADEEDANEAAWLVRLSLTIGHLSARGPEDAQAQAELAELAPSDALREAVLTFARDVYRPSAA